MRGTLLPPHPTATAPGSRNVVVLRNGPSCLDDYMAHADQLTFFATARDHFPAFFSGTRVLEVGSLDINGSIRHLAKDCEYLGIDLGPGPGVDVISAGQDYDAADDSFDVVLSGECMEHNPDWVATVQNMIRMLRPGGLFLLSCAAPGRPEHGTPRSTPHTSPITASRGQNYYLNLSYADFDRRRLLSLLSPKQHWTNWRSRDIYIAGFKGDQERTDWSLFVSSMDNWTQEILQSKQIFRLEKILLALLGNRTYELGLRVTRITLRAKHSIIHLTRNS